MLKHIFDIIKLEKHKSCKRPSLYNFRYANVNIEVEGTAKIQLEVLGTGAFANLLRSIIKGTCTRQHNKYVDILCLFF